MEQGFDLIGLKSCLLKFLDFDSVIKCNDWIKVAVIINLIISLRRYVCSVSQKCLMPYSRVATK